MKHTHRLQVLQVVAAILLTTLTQAVPLKARATSTGGTTPSSATPSRTTPSSATPSRTTPSSAKPSRTTPSSARLSRAETRLLGMEQLQHGNTNNIMDAEELDIILLPEQEAHLIHTEHAPGTKSRHKRKIVEKEEKRWTMPIFYKFHRSSTLLQRQHIRGALSHWQDQTCVLFFEVNDSANLNTQHLLFTNVGTRCGSNVGKVPQAANTHQIINLPSNCLEKFGTAVHEIGHALGLWHEHQRPDRDGHVTIVNDNLVRWAYGNFDRAREEFVENLGMPYDFNSVMHYAATAGSINGSPTLQTRDGLYQHNIGQRVELSFLDSKVVNTAYCKRMCAAHLPFPCQHGGYQDPNDCGRCRCPDGIAGRFCDKVAPSSHEMCGGTIRLGSDTTVTLTSPGYTEGEPYDNKIACNWLVKAPKDHTIELMFLGDFSVYCLNNVCFHWVEVKHTTNFQYPGPRFCCSSRPDTVLESEGTDMLLIFRANWTTAGEDYRRGFSAALHAKPASPRGRMSHDISGPALTQQTRTTDVRNTSLPARGSHDEGQMVYETMTLRPNRLSSASTTRRSTTTETTTPTTTTTTTTPTTTTTTTTVTTPTTTRHTYIFTWGPWSACTGPNPCGCGGCSTQTRRRLCGGATCPPRLAHVQHRRCTRQCTQTDVVLDFSRNVSISHCPICCPGFNAQDGHCVPG